MATNDRPKTNSITHLVKLVAEEVMKEMLPEKLQPFRNMDKILGVRINRLEAILRSGFSIDPLPDIENCPEHWNTPYAGSGWDKGEECDLLNEFDKAVQWMASQHGRTEVAIRCRLSDLVKQGKLNIRGN